MTDTSTDAITRLAENLKDWGQHDEGVINDMREEASAVLRVMMDEHDFLNATIARIWDHCQNPGIEYATVGMRAIERIEDEIASARK